MLKLSFEGSDARLVEAARKTRRFVTHHRDILQIQRLAADIYYLYYLAQKSRLNLGSVSQWLARICVATGRKCAPDLCLKRSSFLSDVCVNMDLARSEFGACPAISVSGLASGYGLSASSGSGHRFTWPSTWE